MTATTALPKRQQEAYIFFTAALQHHPQIEAILLKGSLAQKGDEWSDLDLHVVVAKESQQMVFELCYSLAQQFKPTLILEKVNFGLPQVVCIYDNHLHVDLYIGPHETSVEPEAELTERLDDSAIEALNTAIYSLHELDIALKRGDFLWAQRLSSHIMADLSLAMCRVYLPKKTYLHLKLLEEHLPANLIVEMGEVYRLMGQGDYARALSKIVALTRRVVEQQPEAIAKKVRTNFLEHFATWPDRYGGHYARIETLPIAMISDWVLSTERLRLRPIMGIDASGMVALLNSPGWLRYIGDRHVHTLEEAGAYIERIQGMSQAAYWVIESHPMATDLSWKGPQPQFMGVVTLLQRDYLPLPDLGFALLPEFCSSGVAKEACQTLLEKLRAHEDYRGLLAITLPDNGPSQKLLIRLGFEPSGLEVKDGEQLIRFHIQ